MITINTLEAPAAIGPYSQAKVHGGFVFLSGQLPLDAKTGAMVGTDIEAQTQQVLRNVEQILSAAGSSFDKVIKTTCFISDMADFGKFNALYGEKFTSKPARSCIAAKQLPKDALVEIELIAIAPNAA